MGKVSDALTFLAIKRAKLDMLDMMDDEQREHYINSLKKNIDDELRAKALQEVLLNKYRSYYSKLLDDGEDDEVLPLMKEINEEKRKKDDETVKSEYVFITVNPRPDVPLTDFRKAVEKSVQKTFIKKSLYVIEQRGENMDELGKGFHTHMLIKKGDYRISHLRREFARTFSKVADVDNPHVFNVMLCKKSDLKKRQNYMIGDKADEKKRLKQEMDKVFRDKYAIMNYYGELYDPEIAEG